MKLKTIRMGLVISSAAIVAVSGITAVTTNVFAQPLSSIRQSVKTNQNGVIYNNPANSKVLSGGGDRVTVAQQFDVTDKNGQVSSSDPYSNAQSIIDYDQFNSVSFNSVIENKTGQDLKPKVFILTPNYYAPYFAITPTVADKPVISATGADLDNMIISYSAGDEGYVSESSFLSRHSWSELKGIEVQSTGSTKLPADAKINVNIKMNPNVSSSQVGKYGVTMEGGIMNLVGGDSVNSLTTARFSRPSNLCTNFVGVKANEDATKYTLLDDDIQKLLPAFDNESYKVNNFKNKISADDPSESVIYIGSIERYDLTSLKNDINEKGLAVGVDTQGNQATSYTYALTENADGTNISNPDGTPANVPTGSLAFDIHQVIKTKDLDLKVGDDWQAITNAKSKADTQSSLVAALDPTDDKIDITSKLTEEDNVDTSKPGDYTVKYSYQLGDATISKTAKVTVNKDNNSDGNYGSGNDDNNSNNNSVNKNDDSSKNNPSKIVSSDKSGKLLPQTDEILNGTPALWGLVLLVLGSLSGVMYLKLKK